MLLQAALIAAAIGGASALLSNTPLSNARFDRRSTSISENVASFRTSGSARLQGGNVRLTADIPDQKGLLWTAHPLELLGKHCRIDVTFQIHGSGATLFADGIAVYISDRPNTLPGNILGGQARYKGIAVFIDTFANDEASKQHQHPYISLSSNDGSELPVHDGIGTTSSLHAPAGCTAPVRQAIGEDKIAVLRIDYDATNGTRSLTTKYVLLTSRDDTPSADAAFTPCFGPIDPGVDVLPGYWLSLSAATGTFSDNHDILDIAVYGQEGASLTDIPEELLPLEEARQQAVQQGRPLGSEPVEAAPSPTDEKGQEVQAQPSQLSVAEEERRLLEAGAEMADPGAGKSTAGKPPQAASADTEPANSAGKRQPLSLQDLQDMDKDALNTLLRETGIVKFIRNKLQESSTKYSDLKSKVDEKVDNMHRHMESILDKLKQQEGELDQRLYSLEQQLKAQLTSVQDSSKAAALSWRLPALGLGLMAALLTGAWCVQYRRLAKMKDW